MYRQLLLKKHEEEKLKSFRQFIIGHYQKNSDYVDRDKNM